MNEIIKEKINIEEKIYEINGIEWMFDSEVEIFDLK